MENWGSKIKKYWNKLTLASKIVFILWTLVSIDNLFSEDVNYFENIITCLFGYLLLVGVTQLISNRKKAKKRKETESSYNRVLLPTESLPIILESNLILSDGEICHYCDHATFVKTKML